MPTPRQVRFREVRSRDAIQRSSAKEGMGVKFIAMEHEHRARFAELNCFRLLLCEVRADPFHPFASHRTPLASVRRGID